MKTSLIQRSAVGLGIALVLTLLGGLGSQRSTHKALESAHWVEHTREVLQSLEALAASLRARESSVRGFVITGSAAYLEDVDETVGGAATNLARLRGLIADNASQQRRLDNLERLVARKLDFLTRLTKTRAEQGLQAGIALALTNEGRFAMEDIELAIHAMRAEESELLRSRMEASAAAAQTTSEWGLVGTALALLLIGTTGYFLIREIRRRQRANTALRHQTSVLESVLRCMREGVVVADANSRLTQFNPAAERILGVGMRSVAASAWTETYHLFRADQVTPYAAQDVPLARAIRGEDVDNAEIFIRHPDRPAGDWVSVNARPLFDDTNQRIGGVVVMHDTTAQKHAESAGRHSASNLRHAYRELDLKVQALARANRELEQFAYIASHDLQEPLRMVSSFCQLIKKRYHGQLDEKADKWLDFATDGAARMHVLIQDLLQYSRAGRSEKPAATVDLDALLIEVQADLALAIHDAAADIRCDPLPAVMGDRTQLHQLFQNLISNALKFHGSEPPVIRITSRCEEGILECTVRDNGIGIEPQHFERIFKIFHRLHNKQDYPGTGIGLAVCAKIVECHGGRIWVESTPNQGTEFHFTLPVAGNPQPADQKAELQIQ